MLDLASPRWRDLAHAYGSAADIPDLLRQLHELPKASGKEEPWFSIWSALAHQGDVYSASFAAVPHVINALAKAPDQVDESYFQFPAWVEICRAKNRLEPPVDLRDAYFKALALLPKLVATAASNEWDTGFLASALAAVAAAKGQHEVAEAVMEMSTPKVATDFLAWFQDQ